MESRWRECLWGDLATLEYGKGLRGYEYAKGPYRVFGTNGPIGWHSESLCKHSTVVIGRKGAYRGVHFSAAPCFAIDTAFYLSLKTDFDMRWAYYELLTQDINGMDSGSAIPSTSREAFYNLRVKVPPLPEQRAIAHILGTLDDKIELNRRMNETLEAMARAIFKSWFVDFLPVRANMARTQTGDPVRAKMEGRLPAPSDARQAGQPTGIDAETAALFPDSFEDSPLGKIPKGWEVSGLDGIARFLNGPALQKFPPDDDGSLPVIKIAQLRAGDTREADRASAKLNADYVVKDGDVLFSWSGSLECVLWAGGKGALNQHLFKVTSERFPKWFYFLWIHRHLPDFRRIAVGKATTMGHIQRHHLTQALAVVPSSRVLAAADRQIAPLVDSVIRNAVQSSTLTALRDTLLPKLISGELRIKDVERIVETAV